MKRRSFLKKLGAATAATAVAPYILPSGRLFAATGARKANHVVFVLFAGGVRNLESMQKAEGNLMPYTLIGTEPISGDIIGGMSNLPAPSGQPLQNYGTLFKEFRYSVGPTGHYNAHVAAMTGVYNPVSVSIKEAPKWPTIFEYYRKHNSPTNNAMNAWWVSNALGPYPYLHYSTDDNYGAIYGANYIQPASLFSQAGYNVLGDPKSFTTSEKTKIEKIRGFCDENFGNQFNPNDAGMTNSSNDVDNVESYILNSLSDASAGLYNDPWGLGGSMNADMYNMFFAEEIIKEFTPELLVVNIQDIDVCHTNFTGYCNNIRRSDYALWHLWDTIQSTPGMANDTILIAVPEHGRNSTPNTIIDQYGRYAVDHTNDNMSREIFCLVLGPSGVVMQNQQISSVTGETTDVVPTIANILGFEQDIPSSYRSSMGSVLNQAFV